MSTNWISEGTGSVSKPLIGISTYQQEASWGVWTLPAALVPAGYPRLVQRSGGLPVLLPPGDPAAAAATVARLDAVVIAGGADVAPARYGAEPHPAPGRRPWTGTPGNWP